MEGGSRHLRLLLLLGGSTTGRRRLLLLGRLSPSARWRLQLHWLRPAPAPAAEGDVDVFAILHALCLV